ncbi:rRNA-binding ribosome biosynthesis protein [Naganishia albida]|nr:rRNA-binding ribosome biosynthesis protein [Naganishia albida]
MAKRRKNRTHTKGANAEAEEDKGPKSFVIKSGEVTRSVSQLVKDMRKVMEPGTASRLRERGAARLRDYLVMAGPLGVSHMMIFTLTEAANVHLRIARVPAGPTLTFRVERYSLMKDLINSSMRNLGKAPGGEYRTPPLLVLNNFQQQPGQPPKPQLKLMASMFQGMFPPIQVERSALPSFRRVLLISYQSESNLISVRHYTISVRPHGVSRRVRKILTAGSSSRPAKVDLGNAEDIADYLLRRSRAESNTPSEASGYTGTTGNDSASETEGSEAESDSNAVELPEDYVGRGNKKGTRKAVRLVEMGPRMELRLVKIVEGLVGSKKGEGETVFHEFVHKSKADAAAQQAEHVAKRKAREARRKQQEANVARKQAALDAKKPKKKQADEGEEEEDSDADKVIVDDDEVDVAGFSSEDEDDEFEYEDRFAKGGERDDGEDWNDEVDAGDVSEDEDELAEESSEDEAPPAKKPQRSKAKGRA